MRPNVQKMSYSQVDKYSVVPSPKSADVAERFRRQRRRDTVPELMLRKALHRRGLPGMRSRADVVFGPARVAVFLDGCFWHGCPIHATWPTHNAEWWRRKIDANRDRDARVDALLAAEGWLVVRVWEHEDPEQAAERVAEIVARRRQQEL